MKLRPHSRDTPKTSSCGCWAQDRSSPPGTQPGVPAPHAASGAGRGGALGAGERRATSGGRGQGRSGARMRGRLCVGRTAAAAAAATAAVAVPLAGGQEGSPGGVRRGSRGTTMVKKRKGRVVIDSDTEDSGSDENLDQVRTGRGGAGQRSGRAESRPRESGACRAPGLLAGAPGLPRVLNAAAAPSVLPAVPAALGVWPGPGDGARRTWRLGQGGGAGARLVGLGLGKLEESLVFHGQIGAAGSRPGDPGTER